MMLDHASFLSSIHKCMCNLAGPRVEELAWSEKLHGGGHSLTVINRLHRHAAVFNLFQFLLGASNLPGLREGSTAGSEDDKIDSCFLVEHCIHMGEHTSTAFHWHVLPALLLLLKTYLQLEKDEMVPVKARALSEEPTVLVYGDASHTFFFLEAISVTKTLGQRVTMLLLWKQREPVLRS